VGSNAGLDRCGKSHLHRDSIPGSSKHLDRLLKLKKKSIYIVCSHKLRYMLLGTDFVLLLFQFSFRVNRVLCGANRSYFSYSVSSYDDGHLLYLQYKF